ncbi:GNAT family N-acetyltransferase [Porphyrobacter sp. AAP82]|uniref:GNAT family N-acetyltransferase n=1 Tax=Porphyrobacter sp. AAP82 TaxID=1248917 RepID=UPI00031F55CA|nr:GNAT family N-acetyltransferase [Porphyrobacter sp. AAP82]
MPEFRHDTVRLILRDWRPGDWPVFFAATNTPPVMRWLGGVMDESGQAALRARIESDLAGHGHTFWVVERRADGALLGFCGLKRSNQPGGLQGLMEVGWRLREDAWGKGYAREAAAAALDLAFTRFGAGEVIALTVERNTASWGLMLRLGMERRADLDFDSPEFDPANPRIIAYAIARDTWEAPA